MSWLRDDDDMLDHEKWRRALRDGGDGALLVWARLRAWCSRRLTDGIIPADMVDEVAEIGRSRSRSRALLALVEHGLCARRACGSLVIVDYLERNPSRAQVLAERERRSEAQRKRRLGGIVTGHAETTDPPLKPDRAEVPSRPVPSRPNPQERDPERARPLSIPDVPGLERVFGGGVARVHSLPSKDPPKEFLDDAWIAGVSNEQARSTWEHYHGAGLPPSGVERLHPWLVKRAKERASQLAKTPARTSPGSDTDTTNAATAFRPSGDHEKFCAAQKLDLAHAVKLYRASPEHERVGFAESERRFLARLKCWAVTGVFHPDGPLPKAKARVQKEANP